MEQTFIKYSENLLLHLLFTVQAGKWCQSSLFFFSRAEMRICPKFYWKDSLFVNYNTRSKQRQVSHSVPQCSSKGSEGFSSQNNRLRIVNVQIDISEHFQDQQFWFILEILDLQGRMKVQAEFSFSSMRLCWSHQIFCDLHKCVRHRTWHDGFFAGGTLGGVIMGVAFCAEQQVILGSKGFFH